MKIYDISPTISSETAVWPGDVSFEQRYLCRISDGSNIDLSSIHTTVHIGAHTDAPSHYDSEGVGIDQRDLSFYFGKCQVISVNIERGCRICPEHVTVGIEAPRVLFHTNSFPDPNFFNRDFCSLSPELVRFLHERDVCLVGIDTPSVDPCDSKELESHSEIANRDMAILEGVVLQDVEDGIYILSAIPLKIKNADASPVRAILIEDFHLT